MVASSLSISSPVVQNYSSSYLTSVKAIPSLVAASLGRTTTEPKKVIQPTKFASVVLSPYCFLCMRCPTFAELWNQQFHSRMLAMTQSIWRQNAVPLCCSFPLNSTADIEILHSIVPQAKFISQPRQPDQVANLQYDGVWRIDEKTINVVLIQSHLQKDIRLKLKMLRRVSPQLSDDPLLLAQSFPVSPLLAYYLPPPGCLQRSWAISPTLGPPLLELKRLTTETADQFAWRLANVSLTALHRIRELGQVYGVRHCGINCRTIRVDGSDVKLDSLKHAMETSSVLLSIDDESRWTAAPECLQARSISPVSTQAEWKYTDYKVGKTADWWSIGVVLSCFLMTQQDVKQVCQLNQLPPLHHYLSSSPHHQWESPPDQWIERLKKIIFARETSEESCEKMIQQIALVVFDSLVRYPRHERDISKAIEQVREILRRPKTTTTTTTTTMTTTLNQ